MNVYMEVRDYMDRWVTPPKRVISPTWDPPPTCKQALKVVVSVKTTLMSLGYNIPRNAMPFDTPWKHHGNGLLTIR